MRYYLILLLAVFSCKNATEPQKETKPDQEEVSPEPVVQEEPAVESEAAKKLNLMQGTWYSTEDPKSYLEVKDDQLIMGYEGVASATNTYAVTIADQLPDDQPSNPDTQYLILTQGAETMTYAIDTLTKDDLKLLYLTRGNFLNFSRTK